MKRKWIICLLAVLLAAGTGIGAVMYQRNKWGSVPQKTELSQRVGVTHADGKYHLTDQPFLLEGAKGIEALGSKVIKLWFTSNAPELYSFASDWSMARNNLVELAQTSYFDAVFRMPFSTYVLETYEYEGDRETQWTDGMTGEECAWVEEQFYRLACYFYETFAGTGKTFVLQNWEGDNALGALAVLGSDGTLPPEGKTAMEGMTAWINARQDGVTRARNEHKNSDVIVANAFEVNFIDVERDLENYDNRVLAVDEIVPKTHCDLYSLSCWGAKETGLEPVVADKLQYYRSKAPASELYGENNLMLGEFGTPEMLHKTKMLYDETSSLAQKENVRLQLEYALQENVRYAIYWEIYCNEARNPAGMVDGQYSRNEDLSGYWLIRADGTITATYEYLKELLRQ